MAIAITFTIAVLTGQWASAQLTPIPTDLAPLSSIPVPELDSLTQFVANKTKVIELGKALFWDVQVRSDSVQPYATCHFMRDLIIAPKIRSAQGCSLNDRVAQMDFRLAGVQTIN